MRAVGPRAAALTIAGDIAKGAIPVVLARLWWPDAPAAVALAAIFSVIGHNYSLFLGFKGGAGTMTATGALLGLDPLLLLLSAIIPLVFTYITRMSSVGSLLGSAVALLLAIVLVWQAYLPVAYLLFFVPFFLLSWISHRPNIARLQAGTERRLGEKARA